MGFKDGLKTGNCNGLETASRTCPDLHTECPLAAPGTKKCPYFGTPTAQRGELKGRCIQAKFAHHEADNLGI